MSATRSKKADHTRHLLLETALGLFREKGFDKTTMRDIARASQMSLGAAYYYFKSKEDLVLAYYESLQDAHDEQVRSAAPLDSLEDRLERAFLTKIDLIEGDRRFLSAIFRYAAEPDHPLSVFSPDTSSIRDKSRETFRFALGHPAIDSELSELVVDSLWLAHLALTLYALHDDSPALQRTRRLALVVSKMTATGIGLLQTPGLGTIAKPMLAPLAPLLDSLLKKRPDHSLTKKVSNP